MSGYDEGLSKKLKETNTNSSGNKSGKNPGVFG